MANRKANVTNGILFNYRTDDDTNKYTVVCQCGCNRKIEAGNGVKFNGLGIDGFIYPDHAPELIPYHGSSNPTYVGNACKDGEEKSIEMETVWMTNNALQKARVLQYLVNAGYKPERDGSLYNMYGNGTEFKNCIYRKGVGLSEILQTMRAFDMQGVVSTEDDCCGTHLNFSNDFIRHFGWKDYGRDNFEKIAQASIDVLANDDRLTAICFGRACTYYAGLTAGGHTSAINTNHLTERWAKDTRFEFRIMKLHTGIDQGGNRFFDGLDIWRGWCKTLQTAIEKGWAVDRIATKCATYLQSRMEKMASEVDDEWIEWVTR